MKANESRCVVVGNGLSTLNLFYAPELLDSSLKLHWRPSSKLEAKSSNPFFLVVPTSLVPKQFKTEQLYLGLRDIYFYISGTERYRGDHFLNDQLLPSFSIPLRRKIVSLSLFNDPTPLVWNEKESEPIAHWVKETSVSFKDNSLAAPHLLSILPLHALNRALASFYPDTQNPENHKVVEMKSVSSSGGVVASYPPPHQAELFQYVFCTDFQHLNNKQQNQQTKTLGHWQTILCKVPRSHITALPKLSVWSEDSSSRFMKTAQIQDACLKRVFVYDIPQSTESYLQVQIFRTHDNPLENPLSFLDSICPRLQKHNAKLESCILEDDWIFSNPLSLERKENAHLVYWKSRNSDQRPESFRKVLRKFKIKKSG